MHYVLSETRALPGFAWHGEPPDWGWDDAGLFVRPAPGTDFWQRTHYGFMADNGHFLFTRVAGDWVLRATVRSHPCHQYDQAGLMVRVDAGCWLKTSVEFEPGDWNRLGVVVTNRGFSDWSTQDLAREVGEVSFRVERGGSDFTVSFRRPGLGWSQLRVAHLDCDRSGPLAVGPYACSPKGAGFRCVFTELSIETQL